MYVLLLVCSAICGTGQGLQIKRAKVSVNADEFALMQGMARVVIYFRGVFRPPTESDRRRIENIQLHLVSSFPVYKFCHGENVNVPKYEHRKDGSTVKMTRSLKNKNKSTGNNYRLKKRIPVIKDVSAVHGECAIFSVALDRFKGRKQIWLVGSSWDRVTAIKKLQKVQHREDEEPVTFSPKLDLSVTTVDGGTVTRETEVTNDGSYSNSTSTIATEDIEFDDLNRTMQRPTEMRKHYEVRPEDNDGGFNGTEVARIPAIPARELTDKQRLQKTYIKKLIECVRDLFLKITNG